MTLSLSRLFVGSLAGGCFTFLNWYLCSHYCQSIQLAGYRLWLLLIFNLFIGVLLAGLYSLTRDYLPKQIFLKIPVMLAGLFLIYLPGVIFLSIFSPLTLEEVGKFIGILFFSMIPSTLLYSFFLQ